MVAYSSQRGAAQGEVGGGGGGGYRLEAKVEEGEDARRKEQIWDQ